MKKRYVQTAAGAGLILPLVLFLSSCETGKKKGTTAHLPVASLPRPESANLVVPLSPPHISFLNLQRQESVVPSVEEIIHLSEAKFQEGEKNLKSGYLLQAKRHFDESLEIILRSGVPVHDEENLRRQYESLIDRIFSYEFAALKAGDGFNEDRFDAAPLEEINIGELPQMIDPRSRQKAEETLREAPHDLPLVVNDMVLRFMDFFQGRGRKAMVAGMQRAGRYRAMISRILAEEAVPQDLLYLCQAESGFRPLALSVAKCKGLWQFASSRGKEYGLRQNWWIDERSDPEKSTRAAARHLKDLYRQFGDWLLAMAAYNTGPGNVERAVARTGYADYWEIVKRGNLHPQTVDYIPIILAMGLISKEPQKYGFEVQTEPNLEVEAIPLDSAIDLRLVAESLNLPLGQVQELNPHVRRLTTPRNDPDFRLYIPRGMKVHFLDQIAAIPVEKRASWRLHQVREGERLVSIAKKYRTTASMIAEANGLEKGQNPKVGEKLIIPMSVRRVSEEPTENAQGNHLRYKVRKGDTLAGIAQKHRMTVAQLRQRNQLETGDSLRAGQTLLLSAKSESSLVAKKTASTTSKKRTQSASSENNAQARIVHKVKKGETLSSIAANYNTSVASLREWNNFSKRHYLQIGDPVTIYQTR